MCTGESVNVTSLKMQVDFLQYFILKYSVAAAG
jgi:hypothetical protein